MFLVLYVPHSFLGTSWIAICQSKHHCKDLPHNGAALPLTRQRCLDPWMHSSAQFLSYIGRVQIA